MTLKTTEILTPSLLKREVFRDDEVLRLVRAKSSNRIDVANHSTPHLDMIQGLGIKRESVASAAMIQFYDEDLALGYTVGGKSLNSEKYRFTFIESEGERNFTISLLEEMLKAFKKSGVHVFPING